MALDRPQFYKNDPREGLGLDPITPDEFHITAFERLIEKGLETIETQCPIQPCSDVSDGGEPS